MMNPEDVFWIKTIIAVGSAAISLLLLFVAWLGKRAVGHLDTNVAKLSEGVVRFDGKLDGIAKTTQQNSTDIVVLRVEQRIVRERVGRLGILYDDIAGFLAREMKFKKRGEAGADSWGESREEPPTNPGERP